MKKFIYVFCIMLLSGSGIHAQWITQASGFSMPNRVIGCIYAVNDQVVWASAYDANTPSASCQDITVTTNGGTLWTPHTLAGLNSLDIANIVAVNASTAWVCMYPATSFLMGQGNYKTTDGGVTWNQQTTAAFSNATSFANVVYFWDQNTGYVSNSSNRSIVRI